MDADSKPPETGVYVTGEDYVTAPRRSPSRFPFTVAALTAIETPPDKPQLWVYDSKTPGLACLIGRTKRTYYFIRKRNGRPERVRLGTFPQIPIEAVRKMAAKEAVRIDTTGKSTNDEKAEQRHELTIGQLFERFIALPTSHRVKRPRKPRTIEEYRKQMDRYLCQHHAATGDMPELPSWEHRRLHSITPRDIRERHTLIGQRFGNFVANRTLALLRAMFNVAKQDGYEKANPCEGLTLFPEPSRTRFVTGEELPRFAKAVQRLPEHFQHFFWLAICTGARRSNIEAMRWENVDLVTRTWTIPAGEAKAGQAVTIPLVPQALEILIKRHKQAAGEWVFPAATTTGHMTQPWHAWRQVCNAAGLRDCRVHDLRRSLGSWMAGTGASLTIIGAALGHRSTQSTSIYARLATDPIRKAMTTATAALSLAAGRSAPTKRKAKR